MGSVKPCEQQHTQQGIGTPARVVVVASQHNTHAVCHMHAQRGCLRPCATQSTQPSKTLLLLFHDTHHRNTLSLHTIPTTPVANHAPSTMSVMALTQNMGVPKRLADQAMAAASISLMVAP